MHIPGIRLLADKFSYPIVSCCGFSPHPPKMAAEGTAKRVYSVYSLSVIIFSSESKSVERVFKLNLEGIYSLVLK